MRSAPLSSTELYLHQTDSGCPVIHTALQLPWHSFISKLKILSYKGPKRMYFLLFILVFTIFRDTIKLLPQLEIPNFQDFQFNTTSIV